MKRFLSLLLCSILCISCITACVSASDEGLHNFTAQNTYYEGQFWDVSSADWFSNEVRVAYELGLVKGESATSFNPNGNMRISEAITLACRLHSIYHNNGMIFSQGNPWYQVYVDYAVEYGMIYSGQFTDYNAFATRAEFASLLATALPDGALSQINNIESIPDVYGYETYAVAVYKLYNAGVLTGNDELGTFTPYSTIRRCEVAAIISRMALPSMRKYNVQSIKDGDVRLQYQSGSIATEVKSINVDVGDSASFLVAAYGEDVSVTAEYDSSYIDIEWGEWDGDITTLTVSAFKEGRSELIIYIEGDLSNSLVIDVFANETGSAESTGASDDKDNSGVEESTLTIEGVGEEFEYWWSAKIRNTSKVVSAEYSIEESYGEYIKIEVEVLMELLEVVGDATSIQVGYELFDDRGVCVDTGYVYVNSSHTNQVYADTITIFDLEAGDYVLKFRDYVV